MRLKRAWSPELQPAPFASPDRMVDPALGLPATNTLPRVQFRALRNGSPQRL